MVKKNIRLESFRYRVLHYCSKLNLEARNANGQKWKDLVNSLRFEVHDNVFYILVNERKSDDLLVTFPELKFYQRGDSELAQLEQKELQNGGPYDAFLSHNNKVISRLVSKLASNTGFSDNVRKIR